MLDFRVQLALGSEELTEAELEELLAAGNGLVLLKGQWVEVDREQLSQALEHWKQVEGQSAGGISFVEGMRLLAGAPADLSSEDGADTEREWSFIQAGKWLEEILADLRDPQSLKRTAPGNTLKADLRPYQDVGVNWLSFLTGLGLGACLADDMGLGKTVQVIAMLLSQQTQSQKSAKPSLLVLPASLLANWKSEIERFAPSLEARFLHPSQTPKDEQKQWEADPETAFQKTDLVITTYGMLLRQKWLKDIAWRFVILDEAQAIKNPSTRQTQSVKKLSASARIALTGTPVENRLADLWSLFDFLCPGLLGSRAVQAVCQILKRPPTRPLRSLKAVGAALHFKAVEDRQTHHRRPAGKNRDQSLLRPDQIASRALCQTGRGIEGQLKEKRRHRAAGFGLGLFDAVQTGL